jgi:hypothetical protein
MIEVPFYMKLIALVEVAMLQNSCLNISEFLRHLIKKSFAAMVHVLS